MFHSHGGPYRAPSLDYLDFGSRNIELPAHETGQRVAQVTVRRGQASAGRGAPPSRGPGAHAQPDSNNTVHNLLEDLLVRGLPVTLGVHPGSPEGPSLGLKQEGVVLYLPLVRECQGPPKLHVHVNRSDAPGIQPLQVCLSSSTVSFCTEWGASSGGAAPDETARRRKLGEALPAGYSSSAVASTASHITEPAAAGSCIVQLISSCGSLLCFKADPMAPLENQLAHDVLCIFRAFDFDTIRLYSCLCAAVKEAPAHSQFEEILDSLPLFALKKGPSAVSNVAFKAAKVAASTTANTRTAASESPAVGGSVSPERAHEDTCLQWPSWGMVDPALPWATALACSWIVHIANHEDGVRERHALISAFRRFVFSTKEKGPGIVSGIVSAVECPSEGSSLGLDTTVPSEATVAGASACGEAAERCAKTSEGEKALAGGPAHHCASRSPQKTKALNPHAAPFVPRAPFSASANPWGSAAHKPTLGAECPVEGSSAAAAVAAADTPRMPAEPNKAAAITAANDPSLIQHFDAFKDSRLARQGCPKQPSAGLLGAGKQHRCKKSSSATAQRAPRVDVPEHSRSAFSPVQEEGNRPQPPLQQGVKESQQQQHVLQSTPWKRRPHSAPSRSAGSAASAAKAFPRKCQYTLSAMLGMRRQSLLLQPPNKAFNFVLQQQQLQRSPDDSPMPFYFPSALPGAAGADICPASPSHALGRAVAPCVPRPANYDIFCAPPPPPHPRREGDSLHHRRFSQQQPKRGQPPGCSGGSWDGFPNAGPLLPLPRTAPSGPPLLPTPRGPPIAAVPFQKLDQRGLLTGYWGPSGPGPTGATIHTGVPWIPGSPRTLGQPAGPLLFSPMQQDGSRVPLQAVPLQQRDLLQQQMQNQLQQRLLLQGVPSAAFPERPGPPNPQYIRRPTRSCKPNRKGIGCPQQRRQKQSQQQQQQPLHNQSASNKTTPDQGDKPFSGVVPLHNEATLQKLLGMVTTLLMSRSGCKELK